MSSSVRYEDSSSCDFVHPVRSCSKGKLVLVRPVRGMMQERLLPSITKSRNWRAGPHPSGTRNQASRTSSVQTKSQEGELVLIRPVRGIKMVGLCPTGMKLRERKACPCPFGTRNDAGGTSSVRYDVVQLKSWSSSVRFEESSMQDFVRSDKVTRRRAGLRSSGMRNE